jgi:hypothetical protein
MEQRLDNLKWAKTIPETQASFNEMVHIWTQVVQQTATLDFVHQVAMSTQHVILEQIVRKMPPWSKKHMKEHPHKYSSVSQVWVSRYLSDCNFWVNSFRGDLTENLSVCSVAMSIGTEVQCAILSRGIGRTTCIHVVTRHTCGGKQARDTSDYTGPSMSSVGSVVNQYHHPVPVRRRRCNVVPSRS